MAHTPHASAAAKIEHERPFGASAGSKRGAQEAAHEVLRADGLNAVERSEREAAEDENRAEEAEIFERAAARLLPAWATADAMLDLGLANALPQAAEVEPSQAPAPVTASASVAPVVATPVMAAPAAFTAPVRQDPYGTADRTDRFAAQAPGFVSRAGSLLRGHRIAAIAAAVGCLGLGGALAAFSGSVQPAPAKQQPPAAAAVTVAPPAPEPAVPPPAAPVASEEPPELKPAAKIAKPIFKRPAAKLMGKPAAKASAARPIAAKPPVGRPGVGKPLATKQAPKSSAKKPLPQKPAAR